MTATKPDAKAELTERQELRLRMISADVVAAGEDLAKVQEVNLAIGLKKTATTRRQKGLKKARRSLEYALANVKFLEGELAEELKDGAL